MTIPTLKYAGPNIRLDQIYTTESELNCEKIKSLISNSLKERDVQILDLKTKMNDIVLPAIQKHGDDISEIRVQVKQLGDKLDDKLNSMKNQLESMDGKLASLEIKIGTTVENKLIVGLKRIEENVGTSLTQHLSQFFNKMTPWSMVQQHSPLTPEAQGSHINLSSTPAVNAAAQTLSPTLPLNFNFNTESARKSSDKT